MDLRTSLYQVNFAIFLYFAYCHSVASAPGKENMLETILCDSLKFLRNSSYVKQCTSLSYPVEFTESKENDPVQELNFMCITLKHVITKICEYHINDTSQIKIRETADSWCQNMTSFLNVSIQNDTDVSYINYASKIVIDSAECTCTCHIQNGFNPLLVVFVWFDQLYKALESSKKFSISKEAQPSQLKSFETEVSNNAKIESTDSANEQEIKNVEQSEIPDRNQQKQDVKLPSSTDKSNMVENKVENFKIEFQKGNSDSLHDKANNVIEEPAEGKNDNGFIETNKKDSLNDSGDHRSFLESAIIKEEDESNFFIYFSITSLACVLLYIGYHNKQKILAMVLEGRQSRRSRSNRRRPNTANYRKLDSNLEEAVTSQWNSNVTHVIY